MRIEFDEGGSPITIGVLAIIGAMAGGTVLATTMGTAAGVIGVILGRVGADLAVLVLGVMCCSSFSHLWEKAAREARVG